MAMERKPIPKKIQEILAIDNFAERTRRLKLAAAKGAKTRTENLAKERADRERRADEEETLALLSAEKRAADIPSDVVNEDGDVVPNPLFDELSEHD